mgnify:CR=1 FL=1
MSILEGAILGLFQGLAEFLPISSSGHLAIFQKFFGLAEMAQEDMFFDILLHIATLCAVFVAYWGEIKGQRLRVLYDAEAWRVVAVDRINE